LCATGLLQNFDNSETEQLEFPNHEMFLRYEGEVRDGKPWGKGNMTFKNGGFYSGDWTDGLRNGEGIQKYAEESEREHYTGSWKNDIEHGQGVLVYKNGEKYEGSMSVGIIQGNGTLTLKNGEKYQGQFLNNKKHGNGIEIYSENDSKNRVSYDGEWKEGDYSGTGTMIWKDGAKYNGEWQNGYRTGNGTYYWSNGQKYVGDFLNAKRHGLGIETYPENDTFYRISYDGEWKEDKKSGNGTQTWKSGDKYVGEWQNGDETGKGTYYWPSGNKYVGDFLNDKLHGNGIKYSATNAIIQEGKWENDKFIGK
jgi:hypothetical protein